MFDNFNATKAERAAIDAGFRAISRFARSEYEANQWDKIEARGPLHDRQTLLGALMRPTLSDLAELCAIALFLAPFLLICR